jgi:ATP-dependent Zn protease
MPVDLPDVAGRTAILSVLLRGEMLGADADVARLAAATARYSGADLKALCIAAALAAIRRAMATTASTAPSEAPTLAGWAGVADWARLPAERTLLWEDFARALTEVR